MIPKPLDPRPYFAGLPDPRRETRNDHSAENLALIRRMALNVLRYNGPPRDSIRRCKLRTTLNDE